MYAIEHVRQFVRTLIRQVARAVNSVTGGRVTPNHVTAASVLLHVWVALAIAQGRLVQGGILLVVFGLMDTLDGELARLQKSESQLGVVFDASADRAKEALIYAGLAVYLARDARYEVLFLAVLALGLSVLVSYVKAKGEAMLSSIDAKKLSVHQLNRLLGQDSLMRFEIRMAVLVAGLLTGFVGIAVGLIAALSAVTVVSRLSELNRALAPPDTESD